MSVISMEGNGYLTRGNRYNRSRKTTKAGWIVIPKPKLAIGETSSTRRTKRLSI